MQYGKFAVFGLGFALSAGMLLAGEGVKSSKTAPQKQKVNSSQAASAKKVQTGDGMRVFLDPVTRRPRVPEAAEAAALERLIGPQPSTPDQTVRLRNGALALKAAPEHRNFAVATRNADGTISFSCVQGTAATGTTRKEASNDR